MYLSEGFRLVLKRYFKAITTQSVVTVFVYINMGGRCVNNKQLKEVEVCRIYFIMYTDT